MPDKNIPDPPGPGEEPESETEISVGRRLRALRVQRNLSLRTLAGLSGLNVNTLALVENGKSSPSVSTLQQMARALEVPLAAFFETESIEKKVVFTPAGQRPPAAFGNTQTENLAKNLAGGVVQPFVVTLEPGMGSGDRMIVHTGYEFVFCLSGMFRYQIDEQEFILKSGDSLVFESHLPHCWENNGVETVRFLLTLVSSHAREEPARRHFSPVLTKKELNMKIAVITDDGRLISRHFGRAQYYMVLTIEEGRIVNREMLPKLGHNQFGAEGHAEEHHGPGHGMDAESHDRHARMAGNISDCQAVICGGMGMGAYESMRRLNIQPIVTDMEDIEEAARAYIEGRLVDQTDLLH